jgi:hypothetical protein
MEDKMDTTNRILKYSIACCLSFLAILGGFQAKTQPIQQDAFTRTYHWDFEGCTYSMAYQIPWETYHFYQEKPRVFQNFAVYTFENQRHAFLSEFVRTLECKAEATGMDRRETLNFVIAFVQQLQYRNDQGEYPKFPVETLAEFGGDCEDTSILLAAMLREMGYATVFINPPGHMAIAMACDDCEGVAYRQDGRRYYYIETTAGGFGIGDIPEDYQETSDKVLPMTARPSDLWVLREFIPKRSSSDRMVYSASEDAATCMGTSQRGEPVIAKATLRSVQIDGKVSTSRSVVLAQ